MALLNADFFLKLLLFAQREASSNFFLLLVLVVVVVFVLLVLAVVIVVLLFPLLGINLFVFLRFSSGSFLSSTCRFADRIK